MNKRILLREIVGILIISILAFVLTHKMIKVESYHILDEQEQLEGNIEWEGYTFEHPNVMLDPYENAPLSALVLFETSEEVAVRVTIKGKDENTTYSYEFDKAYVHMLPIYGLYPSCMNEVIIEAEGKENV